jgi:hypothetical protein
MATIVYRCIVGHSPRSNDATSFTVGYYVIGRHGAADANTAVVVG